MSESQLENTDSVKTQKYFEGLVKQSPNLFKGIKENSASFHFIAAAPLPKQTFPLGRALRAAISRGNAKEMVSCKTPQ